MNVPEKLNLWDRIFNRYRRVIVNRGSEQWNRYRDRYDRDPVVYQKDYVEYRVIDRVTGSERIEKEYLD